MLWMGRTFSSIGLTTRSRLALDAGARCVNAYRRSRLLGHAATSAIGADRESRLRKHSPTLFAVSPARRHARTLDVRTRRLSLRCRVAARINATSSRQARQLKGPVNFQDIERTKLRVLIADIELEIPALSSQTTAGQSAAASRLAVSWATLVELLALGPEPELRKCPSCKSAIRREATRCMHCWKQSSHEAAGPSDAGP